MLQLPLYFAKLASVLYINPSCFCMSVKPATSLTTGYSNIYFSKDPDYISCVDVELPTCELVPPDGLEVSDHHLQDVSLLHLTVVLVLWE